MRRGRAITTLSVFRGLFHHVYHSITLLSQIALVMALLRGSGLNMPLLFALVSIQLLVRRARIDIYDRGLPLRRGQAHARTDLRDVPQGQSGSLPIKIICACVAQKKWCRRKLTGRSSLLATSVIAFCEVFRAVAYALCQFLIQCPPDHRHARDRLRSRITLPPYRQRGTSALWTVLAKPLIDWPLVRALLLNSACET
jgi:hypothetical protein